MPSPDEIREFTRWAGDAPWSFVYVMHAPALRCCKVGHAQYPAARLREVRADNALRYAGPIELVHALPCLDHEFAEQAAHVLLRQRWVAGEWFRVDPRTARAAVHFGEHFDIRMRKMRDAERFVARLTAKIGRPLPPPYPVPGLFPAAPVAPADQSQSFDERLRELRAFFAPVFAECDGGQALLLDMALERLARRKP